MKRSLLALVAVAALALTGCVPGPVPVTGLDKADFYEQELRWKDCFEQMECTSVRAPLDWSAPEDGSIKIAVVRHRAKNPIGSLLINPGGPGGSGVGFVADSLDYAVDARLIENFDIVGFDPRGVGESTAVTCLEAAEMDEYLYGRIAAERGSAEWLDEVRKHSSAFAEACAENSGRLLENVDTDSAARDLDLLRAVLGDEKLNYLGYSYGTYLGARYAELFPQNVGRLVLDGAIDPAVSVDDVNIAQAQGFEQALRAYLSDCLASGECPFTGDADAAMLQVRALLDTAAAQPLQHSDSRLLTAETLLTAIIYPLYSAEAWPLLSDMFEEVYAGKTDMAFRFADGYNDRRPDGSYGSNSTEAFIAINCLDYRYNADLESMRAQAAALEAAAPIIGSFFGYGDVQCDLWPVAASGERAPVSAAGAPPIIVIGTTGDPATPYHWSVALAEQLPDAVLISYQGEGHTAYNKSNECVSGAVDDFFIDGTVPLSDLNC